MQKLISILQHTVFESKVPKCKLEVMIHISNRGLQALKALWWVFNAQGEKWLANNHFEKAVVLAKLFFQFGRLRQIFFYKKVNDKY